MKRLRVFLGTLLNINKIALTRIQYTVNDCHFWDTCFLFCIDSYTIHYNTRYDKRSGPIRCVCKAAERRGSESLKSSEVTTRREEESEANRRRKRKQMRHSPAFSCREFENVVFTHMLFPKPFRPSETPRREALCFARVQDFKEGSRAAIGGGVLDNYQYRIQAPWSLAFGAGSSERSSELLKW